MSLVFLLTSLPWTSQIDAASGVIGSQNFIPSDAVDNNAGAIGLNKIGFAVSIMDTKFETGAQLKEDMNITAIDAKFKEQYRNKFPGQSYSTYFIHENMFPSSGNPLDGTIAWYNSSTGSLEMVPKSTDSQKYVQQSKLRKMDSGASSIANVNYSKIYNAIKNAKNVKNLTDALGNGKWKSLINMNANVNIDLWSALLKNNGANINANLKAYLKIGGASPGIIGDIEQTAAWIDLLGTLWALSPQGTETSGAYVNAIENLLKLDSSVYTNPPHLTIVPCVTLTAPNYVKGNIYMSAIQYAEYLYGAAPAYKLSSTGWQATDNSYVNASDGWRNLIDLSIRKSLSAIPSRKRATDLTGNAAKANGFNWGMGSIYGMRVSTANRGANPNWYSSSVDVGLFELLTFNGGMKGFAAAYSLPLLAWKGKSPVGTFSLKATQPETDPTLVGDKEPTLGKNVELQIKMVQNPDALKIWKPALEKTLPSGYPQVKISLKRTDPAERVSGNLSGVADTNPKLAIKSATLSGFGTLEGDDVYRPVSKENLLKMLSSDKESITYLDECALFKIPEKSTKVFKYEAKVSIKLSADPSDEIILDANPVPKGATDKTVAKAQRTFKRGIAPTAGEGEPEPPQIWTYRSQPSYWSEIKNGSPGNETFEAMAGVPTTRPLYFASGGSEYIVEAEFEYVKDTEIERTYRSYYSSVDSEFKAGDNARTAGLGGHTVDLHNGGTYTKSWSGSIPNRATAVTESGSGTVTATCAAVPDRSAYEAAKAAAQEYADSVNSTTLSYTSASDKKTRSQTGWSASITTDSPRDPQTTSKTASKYHPEVQGTPPNQTTIQVPDPVTATASPGGAGSFSIVVSFTVPAHIICGPACTHVLPSVEDTWTQKVKFDHMKINGVKVWKLDQANVNGMTEITGTDEIKASVVQGDPTFFHNISSNNKSATGRIRYSVEPNQHDTVVWYEGVRSNKEDGLANNGVSSLDGHASSCATGIIYTNGSYSNVPNYHVANSDAKDKATPEYAKFEQRRKTSNTATIISDFLILQTSSGDQSILYFQKDSQPANTQDNFVKVAATKQEMVDDNPNSFYKMTPDDINIGSYNGKYYTPTAKYNGFGTTHVATKFDTVPAGFNRTSRPTAAMRLMQTNIDIIDTNRNGFYPTGVSNVFYRKVLDAGTIESVYDSTVSSLFGAEGMEFESTYSDTHSKINDIVLHNPVSTEFAFVKPLDSSRDQRTDASKLLGGNLQEATTETIKKLKNSHPKQNLIWNGDAEVTNSDGSIADWKTWSSKPSITTFTRRTDSDWKISGTGSFEMYMFPAGSSEASAYYKDVPGIGGDSYSFSGKISGHRCQAYFAIDARDASGKALATFSSIVPSSGIPQTLNIDFTAPAGTTTLRVHIVKGIATDFSHPEWGDHIFADDLVLYDNTTTEWQAMSYETKEISQIPNPKYITPYTIPNPNYVPPSNGEVTTFYLTGTEQTFKAPVAGIYTLEVWGAQGGGTNGGAGGYSKGDVYLSKDEILYVYVGGQNGWNGGGSGSDLSGGGGGGGTDIRIGGTALSNRVIVAGGGGGGAGYTVGGAGGGTHGGTGGTNCGGPGAGGGPTAGGAGGNYNGKTFGSSGSLGQGGNAAYGGNAGGGGGGYYGGGGAAPDYPNFHDADDSGGGGGSGYTGGVLNGETSLGVNPGHGYAKIKAPETPGSGSPTILVNNRDYVPSAKNTSVIFSDIGTRYWTVPTGITSVDVLVVGGGGGGGSSKFSYGGGGGGGAGGVVSQINYAVTPGQHIAVTVGAGGSAGVPGAAYQGSNGAASAFKNLAAEGGGGGGSGGSGGLSVGRAGGSGGGAGYNDYTSSTIGLGTVGQGNNGGNNGGPSGTPGGGGGGGAGGAGLAPTSDAASPGGVAGAGLKSSISGSEVTYASGGNGGGIKIITSIQDAPGNGGSGGYAVSSPTAGRSGVVILRYGNATGGNGEPPYIEGLQPYISGNVTTTHTLDTAPEDWYEIVTITTPPTAPVTIPGGATYTPGNFINIDYEFSIYFPNRGDFYGDGSWGIGNVSAMRGKGFVNSMDTTEWTKEKYVTFEFNAIYNGTMYRAGENIPLDVNDSDSFYEFYCPLANLEAISSEVQFKAIATNGEGIDNQYPANKERGENYDARHSGIKRTNIDVVGRIGNLIMEDTGDYRFSNLFKKPKSPVTWFIPGVVKNVYLDQQSRILGDRTDIRGLPVESGNHWLDTYGMLDSADSDPITFPLTPDKNNIDALKNQPLRIGYKSFMDVQTIGNYSNGSVQIIPYYYSLNLSSGVATPVDVYMNVNGEYKPINIFNAAVPGWNTNSVYNNPTILDWESEKERRNYKSSERLVTETVAATFKSSDAEGNEIDSPTPVGKYFTYGNNQILQLIGRNRTFIGTSTDYGRIDTNPGNKIDETFYGLQGQRWHFTTGLPSSAKVVEHGKEFSESNVKAVSSNTRVLLIALDVKAIGSTYVLDYGGSSQNGSVTIAKKSFNLSTIPYKVVMVMSSTKSSKDDLVPTGTH